MIAMVRLRGFRRTKGWRGPQSAIRLHPGRPWRPALASHGFEEPRLVVSKQPRCGTWAHAKLARPHFGPPPERLHPIPLRRHTAIASTAIHTDKALTNGKLAKT